MRMNNKGFSLIELMVVVAIIGVLASVGLPQLNKYISKSRQSEARINLSGLYTAEKATFAEWNLYSSDFGQIGYAPEGKLRYNVGFSAMHNAITGHPVTSVATAFNSFATCSTAVAPNCSNNGAVAMVGTSTMTPASAFKALAEGAIGGAAADVWDIDEKKNLVNSTPNI